MRVERNGIIKERSEGGEGEMALEGMARRLEVLDAKFYSVCIACFMTLCIATRLMMIR
jgi:hypothetical protein